MGGLKFLIRNKWASLGGLVVILVATIVMVQRTPTGFIPTEDQGFIAIAVNTPSGTSLDGTQKVMTEAENTLKSFGIIPICNRHFRFQPFDKLHEPIISSCFRIAETK